jgi:hypothetical protein
VLAHIDTPNPNGPVELHGQFERYKFTKRAVAAMALFVLSLPFYGSLPALAFGFELLALLIGALAVWTGRRTVRETTITTSGVWMRRQLGGEVTVPWGEFTEASVWLGEKRHALYVRLAWPKAGKLGVEIQASLANAETAMPSISRLIAELQHRGVTVPVTTPAPYW